MSVLGFGGFGAVLGRDLRLAGRQGSDVLLVVGFFVLGAVLFPFAVGPDAKVLARIAGGVIWVMALLAAMLAIAAETAQPATPADFSVDISDGVLRLALTGVGLDRMAATAADSSLEVIRHRIDQVGVSEPVIRNAKRC